MPATAAKTKLTREQCDQYASLNETRLSLERQARTLKKQLDDLEVELLAFVKENGGKTRTVNKFGYILALIMKNGIPSWKEEFIRVAGAEEAERVAALAAETKRESFSLQRTT